MLSKTHPFRAIRAARKKERDDRRKHHAFAAPCGTNDMEEFFQALLRRRYCYRPGFEFRPEYQS